MYRIDFYNNYEFMFTAYYDGKYEDAEVYAESKMRDATLAEIYDGDHLVKEIKKS